MGRDREPLVGNSAEGLDDVVMRSVTPSAAAGLVLLLCACSRVESEPSPDRSASPAAAPSLVSSGPSGAQPASGPLVLARGVRIVPAPKGSDAAKVVRDAREREQAEGRDLVVYVGAKWCDPCRRFHKAAEAGALDGEFPTLSVLEFDLDEDRDRLNAAGYGSEFIPLFAMPGPDGRASSKRFEGSVKGDAAIANIAQKLRVIVAK